MLVLNSKLNWDRIKKKTNINCEQALTHTHTQH